MKKILALVVAFVLCFTAVAGCFTAAAEDAAPTITIKDATAADGKIVIPVEGTNLQSVDSYIISIVLPATYTNIAVEGMTKLGDNGGDYVVNGTTVKMLNEIEKIDTDNDGVINFNVTADVPAVEADVTEKVTATVDAGNADAQPVTVTVVEGNATIKAPVVEPPVTEPTEITATYNHSISLQSSIAVNIYVLKTDEWAACDNLYMVIKSEDYTTGSLAYSEETVYVTSMEPVYLSNAYRYQFVYTGLDAREMGSKFTALVYGVDADGKVIYVSSNEDSYSVLQYCASQFGKNNEPFKVVLADLLNYGAAAQANFNYRTDAPVNEDAAVKDYVNTYETKTAPTLDAVSKKEGTGVDLSNTVACESAVELVSVVKKDAVAGYDFSTLKFVLTYNGVDHEIPSTEFSNLDNDTYYRTYYAGLDSTQFSTDVYVKLYAGDELISITRTYSIEAYCISQIDKYAVGTTQNTLYTMLMTYGYSSANYF